MKHKVKKIKFVHGQDANQMLVKKMLFNFLSEGRVESTAPKIRVIKSLVDKVVIKVLSDSNAAKIVLMKYNLKQDLVYRIRAMIPEESKVNRGGFTKMLRLNRRVSDGAKMARLVWSFDFDQSDNMGDEVEGEKESEVKKVEKTDREENVDKKDKKGKEFKKVEDKVGSVGEKGEKVKKNKVANK
jgi:large subunit ribosomal protein L17